MKNNPNNFDFYNKNVLLPFIQGNRGTNNFDFLQRNNIYTYIYVNEVTNPSPPPVTISRRRIMIIE